jgi:hypothetical protein
VDLKGWRGRLWRLFGRVVRRQRFHHVVTVDELHSIPSSLDPSVMYVAGTGRPKWAVFTCPCDTGHIITLSLQESHTPRWRLLGDARSPSIHPSIDVAGGRRATTSSVLAGFSGSRTDRSHRHSRGSANGPYPCRDRVASRQSRRSN